MALERIIGKEYPSKTVKLTGKFGSKSLGEGATLEYSQHTYFGGISPSTGYEIGIKVGGKNYEPHFRSESDVNSYFSVPTGDQSRAIFRLGQTNRGSVTIEMPYKGAPIDKAVNYLIKNKDKFSWR